LKDNYRIFNCGTASPVYERSADDRNRTGLREKGRCCQATKNQHENKGQSWNIYAISHKPPYFDW
jgi:hypothetical protein